MVTGGFLIGVGIIVALYFGDAQSTALHVYLPHGFTIMLVGGITILIGARMKR
jgi:hypothetical protein